MQERKHFSKIDRREFLKYCGASALGAYLGSRTIDLSSGMVKTVGAQTEAVTSSFPALVRPRVDGKFTAIADLELNELGKEKQNEGWVFEHEYADTEQVLMNVVEGKKIPAYFRVKYDIDNDDLYVQTSLLYSEFEKEGANILLFFDSKNDGGDVAQPDDFVIGVESPPISSGMFKGTGNGWGSEMTLPEDIKVGLSLDDGMNGSNKAPSICAEVKIPKRKYLGESQTVGFMIRTETSTIHEPGHMSYTSSDWPAKQYISPREVNPDMFGDLIIDPNAVPVPEFQIPYIPTMLGLGVLFSYILRKRT